MLRTSLVVRHDDINIATYAKLKPLLKLYSHGYMAKKSNTLSTDEIKKFIDTARDHKHLLTKVRDYEIFSKQTFDILWFFFAGSFNFWNMRSSAESGDV